ATNFIVNNSGTLLLDNTAGGLSSRIGGNAGLTLNGGTFSLLGTPNAPLTQAVGTITLNGGLSTISVQGATNGVSTTTLAAAGMSRVLGATVNFVGVNSEIGSALNQITFPSTNLPGMTGIGNNAILPYAVVSSSSQGFDLATLDP